VEKKKSPDTLLLMAVGVIAIAVIYIAWCWAAKIAWGVEPPEGTSLTAVAIVVGQLLAGGGIQICKKAGKSAKVKEVEAENKELRRQLAAANKQMDKVRAIAGQQKMEGA